jgi:hypothetical protein
MQKDVIDVSDRHFTHFFVHSCMRLHFGRRIPGVQQQYPKVLDVSPLEHLLQENVYQDERPFISARKVMFAMGEPYRSSVELVSFHTVSKVRHTFNSGCEDD